jgi:hypothetical protein
VQESTPREETSRDLRAANGDANSRTAAPSRRARRWVVLVFETVEDKDEKGSWSTRDSALYIVDPKTGGAASTYDPETWADASRAENYACLAQVEASDKFGRWVAYLDSEGHVRWPDGTAAERHP